MFARPGQSLPASEPQPAVHSPTQGSTRQDRSSSPPAPPYSPITPVMPTSDLPPSNDNFKLGPPEETAQPPPPIPFSESDNPDAMALRSTISILQIQRQQTLRDMKTLEQQKKIAVADPEGFAYAIHTGQIKTASAGGLVVGPNPDNQAQEPTDEDGEESTDSDEDQGKESAPPNFKFADFPGAQKVVRCPPINWDKYHIIGESLDKLHKEQRSRPSPGQSNTDGDDSRAPIHTIAAPYSPWTDKLP